MSVQPMYPHRGQTSAPAGLQPTEASRPLCVVYEPNPDGHRLAYATRVARHVLARGERALLLTSESAAASPEFGLFVSGLGEGFSVETLECPAVRDVLEFAAHLGTSTVVVPDGDRVLSQLLTLRVRRYNLSLRILLMRPRPEAGPAAWIRFLGKRLLRRAVSRASNVQVWSLVPPLCGDRAAGKVPDPIEIAVHPECRDHVREALGLGERYWFAIAGQISARKNPGEVAAAIAELPADKVGLILGGRVAEDARPAVDEALQALERRGIPCRRVDRLLTERELDELILAADCCVIAHRNNGSSGILGKSLALGTRVVAAGAESLAEVASRSPKNVTWVPLSRTHIRSAFETALGSPRPDPVDLASEAGLMAEALTGRDDSPTVVQVLLSPRIGGAESVADTLSREWASRGVSNTIVYLDPADGPGKASRRSRLRRLLRLRSELQRLRPEAVVSHSALPNVYSRLAAPRDVSVVTVLHSASDDFASRLLRGAERALARRTHAVVAVSQRGADMYVRRFRELVPVKVIPNGVSMPVGHDGSVNTAGDRPRVVTVARVTRQKSPELWLRVASSIRRSSPEVEFLWAGPIDPEYHDLTASAEALGLSFPGPTDRPYELLRTAHVLFHPSSREAHSVALLEGLACGVPVVCSAEVANDLKDVPGVWTFERENGDDAASVLMSVLDNLGAARSEAQRGSDVVRARYGAQAFAQAYLDLLGVK